MLNLHAYEKLQKDNMSLQINLKGMSSRVTYLTIESISTKSVRRTVIYNLSGQFRRNSSSYDGTVRKSRRSSSIFLYVVPGGKKNAKWMSMSTFIWLRYVLLLGIWYHKKHTSKKYSPLIGWEIIHQRRNRKEILHSP